MWQSGPVTDTHEAFSCRRSRKTRDRPWAHDAAQSRSFSFTHIRSGRTAVSAGKLDAQLGLLGVARRSACAQPPQTQEAWNPAHGLKLRLDFVLGFG